MTVEQCYGTLRKVIDETLEGIGAIRGVPCEIEDIEEQEDAYVVTFKWEDKDATVHRQYMNVPIPQDATEIFDYDEILVGGWVDGNPLYRKVIDITQGLAKDNPIKVCDKPTGMIDLIRAWGIIETTQGSRSNNEILIYQNTDDEGHAIYAKQNFTSYPAKLTVVLEYTKHEG